MISSLLNKSATILWQFILRSLRKRFRSLTLAHYIQPVRDEDIELNVDKRHVSVSHITLDCEALNLTLLQTPFRVEHASIHKIVWAFPWDFTAEHIRVSLHAHGLLQIPPDEERQSTSESSSASPSPSSASSQDSGDDGDPHAGAGSSLKACEEEKIRALPVAPASSAVLCELLNSLTELISSAVKNASLNARRISVRLRLDESHSVLLQCHRICCTSRFDETFGVSCALYDLSLQRINDDISQRDSGLRPEARQWFTSGDVPIQCDVSWNDDEEAVVSLHLPPLRVRIDPMEMSECISSMSVALAPQKEEEAQGDAAVTGASDAAERSEGDGDESRDGDGDADAEAEETAGALSWLRRGIERLTGLRLAGDKDVADEDFEEINSIFCEGEIEADDESRNTLGLIIGGTSELRDYLNMSEATEKAAETNAYNGSAAISFVKSLFDGKTSWHMLYKSSESISFELFLQALELITLKPSFAATADTKTETECSRYPITRSKYDSPPHRWHAPVKIQLSTREREARSPSLQDVEFQLSMNEFRMRKVDSAILTVSLQALTLSHGHSLINIVHLHTPSSLDIHLDKSSSLNLSKVLLRSNLGRLAISLDAASVQALVNSPSLCVFKKADSIQTLPIRTLPAEDTNRDNAPAHRQSPALPDGTADSRSHCVIRKSAKFNDDTDEAAQLVKSVDVSCPLVSIRWIDSDAPAELRFSNIAAQATSVNLTLSGCLSIALATHGDGDGDGDGATLNLTDILLKRNLSRHLFDIDVGRLDARLGAASLSLARAFLTTLRRDVDLPVSPSPSAIDGSPGRNSSAFFDERQAWRDRSLFSFTCSDRFLCERSMSVRLMIASVEVVMSMVNDCPAVCCQLLNAVVDASCLSRTERSDESKVALSVSAEKGGFGVTEVGRFFESDNLKIVALFDIEHSTSTIGQIHHVEFMDALEVSADRTELIVDASLMSLCALLSEKRLVEAPSTVQPNLAKSPFVASSEHFQSMETNTPPDCSLIDRPIRDHQIRDRLKSVHMKIKVCALLIDDGDLRDVHASPSTDNSESGSRSLLELKRLHVKGSGQGLDVCEGDLCLSISLQESPFYTVLLARAIDCSNLAVADTRAIEIGSVWLAASSEASMYGQRLMLTLSSLRVHKRMSLMELLLRMLVSPEESDETETQVRSVTPSVRSSGSNELLDESEDAWSEDVFYSDLLKNIMAGDKRLVNDWQRHGGLKSCNTNRPKHDDKNPSAFNMLIKQLSVDLNSQLSSIASIAQVEIHQVKYSYTIHLRRRTNPQVSHRLDIQSLVIKDRVCGSKFENILQAYQPSATRQDEIDAFYVAAPESSCEEEDVGGSLIKLELLVSEIGPSDCNSNEYLMVRRVASESQRALSTSGFGRELSVDVFVGPLWLTFDFETLFRLQAYFEDFSFNESSLAAVLSPREIEAAGRSEVVRRLMARMNEDEGGIDEEDDGEGSSDGDEESSSERRRECASVAAEGVMFRSFIMSPILLRFDSLPTTPLGRSDGLLTSLNLLNTLCTLEGLELTIPLTRLTGLMTSKELISRLIRSLSDKSNRNRLVRQVARGWPIARSVIDLSSSLSGLLGDLLKETGETMSRRDNSIEAETRSIRKLREIFDLDDWEEDPLSHTEFLPQESDAGSASDALFQLETTEADTLVSWRPTDSTHRAQMIALTRRLLMWVDLQRIVSVRELIGRAKINLPNTLQHSETFFRLLGLESLKMTQRIVSGCTRTLSSIEVSLSDLLLPPETNRSTRSRPTPQDPQSSLAWDFIERGADQFYQPRTASEGLSDAFTHLKRGWNRTLQLGQSSFNTTDSGMNLLSIQAVNTIARVLPIFLLRPVVSMSQALNSAILGARNQLDPRWHQDRRQSLRAPRVWQPK